jgi:hypothetical protein
MKGFHVLLASKEGAKVSSKRLAVSLEFIVGTVSAFIV